MKRKRINCVALMIGLLSVMLWCVPAKASVSGTHDIYADTDNDGYPDGAEVSAGSDPSNTASTPELCDGVDNDLDGHINEGYKDTDGDKTADCVDPDDDNDDLSDNSDSCVLIADTEKDDTGELHETELDDDSDGEGNSCDCDDDNDGIEDEFELEEGSNHMISNSKPEKCDGIDNDVDGLVDEDFPDTDLDGQNNCSDTDDDNDGVPDSADDCDIVANTDQTDTDGDGDGDACDCAVNDVMISSHSLDDDHDGVDEDCDGRESESVTSQALTGDQRYPWADYNAATGEYLVVWQDKRSGVEDDIYGVRLDRNGNRIGYDFPISTAAGHQQRPMVKAEGGGFLVLWHDLRDQAAKGSDLYGTWVAVDGTVGAEMAICSCAGDQWNPVAGYDPVSGTFLVVFLSGTGSGTGNDVFDLWGAVVPAGGTSTVTPFAMITEPGAQRGPQLGYDYENNRYFMAWNDRRKVVDLGVNADYDIYGSRVVPDGTLMDGTGVLLSGAAGNQFRPTVTDRKPGAGINNHLIAWTDYRSGAQADVYGIYVDGNGAAVGSEFAISTDISNEANVIADIDWVHDDVFVGWINQQVSGTYDISSAVIDPVLGIVTTTPIAGVDTGATDEQRGEVVVYTTDGVNDYGFLVVWMDKRSGTDYDIYSLRIWP